MAGSDDFLIDFSGGLAGLTLPSLCFYKFKHQARI
jgi:hypothetical protein